MLHHACVQAVRPSTSSAARPPPLAAAAAPQRSVAAAAFVVEAKQNSLKRQRTAEKARLYNKSRKSEIATRMKKASGARGAGRGVPRSGSHAGDAGSVTADPGRWRHPC